MNNPQADKTTLKQTTFAHEIGSKSALKMKARRNPNIGVWSGLGVTGMIGWSVAVPTILGIALGSWIDAKHWTDHSWTLALLAAGLVLGCVNAWHWVVKEERECRMDQEDAGD